MVVDDGRQIKRADEDKRDATSALVELGESRKPIPAFAACRRRPRRWNIPALLSRYGRSVLCSFIQAMVRIVVTSTHRLSRTYIGFRSRAQVVGSSRAE